VCRDVYGAGGVEWSETAAAQLASFEAEAEASARAAGGDADPADPSAHPHLFPPCMAKTQYSFTTDPAVKGAPTGHVVSVRELRVARGAGLVVVLCGAVSTMPGLPTRPCFHDIDVDVASGEITGLS